MYPNWACRFGGEQFLYRFPSSSSFWEAADEHELAWTLESVRMAEPKKVPKLFEGMIGGFVVTVVFLHASVPLLWQGTARLPRKLYILIEVTGLDETIGDWVGGGH